MAEMLQAMAGGAGGGAGGLPPGVVQVGGHGGGARCMLFPVASQLCWVWFHWAGGR
jgi:hypothetical protein